MHMSADGDVINPTILNALTDAHIPLKTNTNRPIAQFRCFAFANHVHHIDNSEAHIQNTQKHTRTQTLECILDDHNKHQ